MLGVPPLVAHFFVFYYGVLADITPPVALAAYAGASMAGADPFKTGNTAFRLGLGKALVPFVFVFSPPCCWSPRASPGANSSKRRSAASSASSCSRRPRAVTAWRQIRGAERLLLVLASVLVISPSRVATLTGLALALPVLARQLMAARHAHGRKGAA